MEDYFSEHYEWDGGIPRKKKRILPDGATTHFTMQMMDAASGFHRTFADGSSDHTHWSRPGFRFADSNDKGRLAADAAYEERSARMETAWKRSFDKEGILGSPEELDKHGLPDAARAIYASTFQSYLNEGEHKANEIAWKAVRRDFEKTDFGAWVARAGAGDAQSMTRDELETSAEQAYADKVQRMSGGWKQR